MKNIITIILLTFFSFNLFSQDLDKFTAIKDTEIVKLLSKVDKDAQRVSKNDAKIYKEVGKILYQRGNFEEADHYLSLSKGYVQIVEVQDVEPEKVFEQPKVESVDTLNKLQDDKNILTIVPEKFENVSKEDMKKIAQKLDDQIAKLLKEKELLIAQKANQEVIEAKDGTIKILKKDKAIVDLTIQKDELVVETDDLKVEKNKLKTYLIWASIGLVLLILAVVVLLQRKTIKVQDSEIQEQLKDIYKKNTYLEHAAKIIRHDMHSGINTYMPRGIASLEKRLSVDDIKNLKIDGSIKMIKDGLSHTQKVYKSVYEFTNLVKQNVVLEKTSCNLKDILDNYLSMTSYKQQVTIDDLITTKVNESLFCTAIDNLIKNGLKYNDSDTKFVKIFMENNMMVIQDNGRGLSQEDFNKLSEPYTKKENQKETSSGLGLSICLAILKEHNFSVTCEKNEIGTKIKIKF